MKQILCIEVPHQDVKEVPWPTKTVNIEGATHHLDEADIETLNDGRIVWIGDVALSLEYAE